MASNSFGNIFRITTWGESHGKAIGVVIDGCPAGLPICEDEINAALKLRRPGQNPYVSARAEQDQAQIFSGVFEGQTTGAPIAIIIMNEDVDSSKYAPLKDHLRPGHANFTYLAKYNVFDYRGGGRASARETACRVAAGAVAKKLLAHYQIELTAYIKEIGGIAIAEPNFADLGALRAATLASPIFCPDAQASAEILHKLEAIKAAGDSLGGIVEVVSCNLPVGLGDPIYGKLEAKLAQALLSLPATKGMEIGAGFAAARMTGSEHNDVFTTDPAGQIRTATNFAGGTLGGITTGMPLIARVAFKPTSSIKKAQATVTTSGRTATLELPAGSRHDPCVTIRAVPVVEAMTALVLADALLMHRVARL